MLFDTGSAYIWIIGNDCQTHKCKSLKKFNKTQSSSFIPIKQSLEVKFGTGKIEGEMGIEEIHLGDNIIVKN